MLAVSVVICLGMLIFYFKLKSLKGKGETTERVNIENTEGALADIYKQMSGLYGISFSITLDGDNKNCNYIFINAIHYARGFIDAAAPQAL